MSYTIRYTMASGERGIATNEVFDTFEDAGAALVRATDMSEAETLESDNSIARLSVHENVTRIWIAGALEARPEFLIRGEKHGPIPAG